MKSHHEEIQEKKNRKDMIGPIVIVLITFGLVALLLLVSPK